MDISPKPPTAKGPAETFTGEVWIDPITRGLPPSQLNVAAVRFTPGARTAWHTHDGGQTLHVTEGRGLVQVRGQQAIQLRPGDVVYAPDGEEHWHGATPDDFMTHLSITEGAPQWGDHVTDDEYQSLGGAKTALAASDLQLPEAAGGSAGREAGPRSMRGTR